MATEEFDPKNTIKYIPKAKEMKTSQHDQPDELPLALDFHIYLGQKAGLSLKQTWRNNN
jgi:hypothetical protein